MDFRTNELSVSVQDMRPLAPDLSLDREGSKLCARPTAVGNLYDDDDATSYNVEIEAPFKDATGAARAA